MKKNIYIHIYRAVVPLNHTIEIWKSMALSLNMNRSVQIPQGKKWAKFTMLKIVKNQHYKLAFLCGMFFSFIIHEFELSRN